MKISLKLIGEITSAILGITSVTVIVYEAGSKHQIKTEHDYQYEITSKHADSLAIDNSKKLDKVLARFETLSDSISKGNRNTQLTWNCLQKHVLKTATKEDIIDLFNQKPNFTKGIEKKKYLPIQPDSIQYLTQSL